MKLFGYLLVGCTIIAALQLAVKAVACVILLAMVIGFLTKPAETFGMLAFFAFFGLLKEHGKLIVLPILGLIGLALAAK